MWYHRLFVLSFIIALLLADFAIAAVHWDEMWVKHTWNAVPANWESLGNPAAGAMIDIHLALIPDQENALIDTPSEVSNPEASKACSPLHSSAHALFTLTGPFQIGAYLSKEQVAELVSPPPDTVDLVRAWFVHHGIRPSSYIDSTEIRR